MRWKRASCSATTPTAGAGSGRISIPIGHERRQQHERRKRMSASQGRADIAIDATHDPALQSWVLSANGHPDFPIQNLPFGVFRRSGSQDAFRIGVAIGDRILDLRAAVEAGALHATSATTADATSHAISDAMRAACASATLHALIALPRRERR